MVDQTGQGLVGPAFKELQEFNVWPDEIKLRWRNPEWILGGYVRGDPIEASQNIMVGGRVMVRAGVLGTVLGPSTQDPSGGIQVDFEQWEVGGFSTRNFKPEDITRAFDFGWVVPEGKGSGDCAGGSYGGGAPSWLGAYPSGPGEEGDVQVVMVMEVER